MRAVHDVTAGRRDQEQTWICPGCRRSCVMAPLDAEREPGPAPRCPDDGRAFVAHEVLAAADGDPFLGATLAGRFVLLGRLGGGAPSAVYRALDELDRRHVALKL